jgi:alpha-glucosidase
LVFCLEVEAISKQVIELRYKLIPYIYTWMWYASKYWVPLIRPMWMEYPNDPSCFDTTIQERQFFFGPHLLVAPVTSKRLNKWLVYLPKGEWINFFTSEVYKGGKLLSIEIKLSDTLIFVRSGSIIPMYNTVDTNWEKSSKSGIEYAKFGSECEGHVYFDDGTTINHQSDNYGFYKLDDELKLELLEGQGFNID